MTFVPERTEFNGRNIIHNFYKMVQAFLTFFYPCLKKEPKI